LGFTDLPLARGSFTWSNNSSWSRIDRFFLYPDWKAKYPSLFQKRVHRFCSDHFPIILDCDDIQGGKRPFKFENMWLKADVIVDRVRQGWSSCCFFFLISKYSFIKSVRRPLKLKIKSEKLIDKGDKKAIVQR